MDEIKEALKELRDEQKVIRESQIRTESDLHFHIKRSEHLEKLVEIQEARVNKELEEISEQVREIKLPYRLVAWFLGSIGVLAAALEIYSILKGK
jgi:SpoU rRNA methylase family enzyme